MTERLREALERFEAALRQAGHPVVEELRPGLREDEVRARLNALEVDPPQDIVTFFGWHDGYDPGGVHHGWICPVFVILSLDKACQAHKYHQEDLRPSSEYSGEQTEWFPVLRSDAASCVVNYSDVATRGRVAICDAGEVEPVPELRPASLAEPIELWLGYLEAGLWRWDGVRWIDGRSDDQRSAHPWGI